MSHKPLDELRNNLASAKEHVSVGVLYRHNKSGNLYKTIGLTILEETDEVAVRYCPVDIDDVEFVRPLRQFVELVTIDGKELPRFERYMG